MSDAIKEKSKPTLEDIATYSGVSVATVSRVMNNSSPVSKDLEKRVKQAMEELGVEPKRTRGRTKPYIIAFITPGTLDPTAAAIVAGAQDEANRLGACLVVINVSEDPGSQTHNLQILKYLSLDGIVFDHSRLAPEQVIEEYNLGSLPAAVITPFIDSPRFYCISSDRETGMYQATKYLLSLNHRKIAYLSGPPDMEISQSRLKGITRALDEAGLTLREEFYRWGFPTIDVGFQAATSILSQNDTNLPTAMIAFNDLMAIGAMHAIRTCGLTVPDDISVVGFNETYFTPHTNPPLTTVSQPKYREGQMAIQKVYNNLQGYDADTGGFTLLECPLVVRESTAQCPKTR